jgi:hypothetical protein
VQLKPRQVVGLVAIVVFGGILAWTLAKPKRDPSTIPGTLRIDIASTTPTPSPTATPSAAIPLAADLMSVGSQAAKDDLYCAGIVYTTHRAKPGSPQQSEKDLDLITALALAGADKLIAESVATNVTTAKIADAHTAQAETDLAAGKPRLTLAQCRKRAEALGRPK